MLYFLLNINYLQYLKKHKNQSFFLIFEHPTY